MTDTLVSRSLGATFSELTVQPTPPKFRVLTPTIAALVIGTTEMILSSVASSEPTMTVTPTPEVSAPAPAAVVAPLPLVTPYEPQGHNTTIDSALPQAAPAIESTK